MRIRKFAVVVVGVTGGTFVLMSSGNVYLRHVGLALLCVALFLHARIVAGDKRSAGIVNEDIHRIKLNISLVAPALLLVGSAILIAAVYLKLNIEVASYVFVASIFIALAYLASFFLRRH